MKKKLMHNLGLKIGSVFLAILAWLLVVNASDPVRTRTFTSVPVTIENGSYLESMGLSYQLEDGTNTVSVTVRGNSSVVNALESADLQVVADLTQIIDMDSDPVMVPLTVRCSRYAVLNNGQAMSTNPGNIPITLEETVSEDFVITPSTGDTRPDRDYEVGQMDVTPERVTISGPGSIINKIDRVVVQVDVTDLRSDTDMQGQIVIVDKNQDEWDDNQMQYLTLKNIENRMAYVHVTLWSVVSDVGIQVEASGRPASGFQIGEVETTPSTISVVGSEEALEQLRADGNIIQIPSELVDASGQSEDFETKLDLSTLLPENVRLAADVSSTLLVTTSILPYGSQQYEIQSVNIRQQNLGSNLRVLFGSDRIQVRVRGSSSVLASLTAADISASVDLRGLGAGEYELPLSITLPTGAELVSDIITEVTIESTETETSSTNVSITETNAN